MAIFWQVFLVVIYGQLLNNVSFFSEFRCGGGHSLWQPSLLGHFEHQIFLEVWFKISNACRNSWRRFLSILTPSLPTQWATRVKCVTPWFISNVHQWSGKGNIFSRVCLSVRGGGQPHSVQGPGTPAPDMFRLVQLGPYYTGPPSTCSILTNMWPVLSASG